MQFGEHTGAQVALARLYCGAHLVQLVGDEQFAQFGEHIGVQLPLRFTKYPIVQFVQLVGDVQFVQFGEH